VTNVHVINSQGKTHYSPEPQIHVLQYASDGAAAPDILTPACFVAVTNCIACRPAVGTERQATPIALVFIFAMLTPNFATGDLAVIMHIVLTCTLRVMLLVNCFAPHTVLISNGLEPEHSQLKGNASVPGRWRLDVRVASEQSLQITAHMLLSLSTFPKAFLLAALKETSRVNVEKMEIHFETNHLCFVGQSIDLQRCCSSVTAVNQDGIAYLQSKQGRSRSRWTKLTDKRTTWKQRVDRFLQAIAGGTHQARQA
jgi:hypothetical protein